MGKPLVQFPEVTPAHVEELAQLMRPADVAEVLALGCGNPHAALADSLGASGCKRTMTFDGEVAAIFGVVPFGSETVLSGGRDGVVWMLTGRAVAKHPKAFLRWSRPVLKVLLDYREHLINLVDARYLGALRWARWLGFDVGAAVPHGPAGLPFCPISIRRGEPWAQL